MRNTVGILVAGGMLATGALLARVWLTLLAQGFDRAEDATAQAGAQGKPLKVSKEADVYGMVKLVNLDHRKVTLAIETEEGKEQEQTYDLAKDAEILLDGPSTLDELATGTRVGLVFGPYGKDLIAIHSEPYRISVEPKQNEVEIGKPFDVVLRVTNVSRTHQTFWVMLTTWDGAWISSNPQISWDPFNSYRNFPITVKLSPGDVYEKTLAMKATDSGRLFFKMGFRPGIVSDKCSIDARQNLFHRDNIFFLASKRTYWSREATVEVN